MDPDETNLDTSDLNFLDADVSHPDFSHPDISDQNISHPDILDLDVSQLGISDLDVSHPDFAHPDVLDQDVSHPDFLDQDVSHLYIEDLDISQTGFSHPDVSELAPGFLDPVWSHVTCQSLVMSKRLRHSWAVQSLVNVFTWTFHTRTFWTRMFCTWIDQGRMVEQRSWLNSLDTGEQFSYELTVLVVKRLGHEWMVWSCMNGLVRDERFDNRWSVCSRVNDLVTYTII